MLFNGVRQRHGISFEICDPYAMKVERVSSLDLSGYSIAILYINTVFGFYIT